MNTDEIAVLLHKAEALKRLKRAGWAIVGASSNGNESIADHSWGTSFIVLMLCHHLCEKNHDINIGEALQMAIIHDLPESLTTDIPKSATDLQEEEKDFKVEIETKAIEHLLKPIGKIGENLIGIWTKYTEQNSTEARIVFLADKLDMLVHAVSLEEQGVDPRLLKSFFEDYEDYISIFSIPFVRGLIIHLVEKHKEFIRIYKKETI